MVATGPPVWRSGRALPIVSMVVFGLLALSNFGMGEPLGVVIGSGSLGVALGWGYRLLTDPVRADGVGVHLRKVPWRDITVPWSEVADIRSGKDKPGFPLAVVRADGTRLQTRLHPVEHRSLPRYWREQTGRPPEV